MDCFNCEFPDCINDKLSSQDYRSNEVDKFIKDNPTTRAEKARIKNRERMRKLRAADPEFNKKYYQNHRESELKRNADWYQRNKEYANAKRRENYAKKRERQAV
jgi:hypothetical protein